MNEKRKDDLEARVEAAVALALMDQGNPALSMWNVLAGSVSKDRETFRRGLLDMDDRMYRLEVLTLKLVGTDPFVALSEKVKVLEEKMHVLELRLENLGN